MNWLSQYVAQIIGVCIIASLARKMLSGSKHFTALGNVIIGIFLIFSILSPILKIQWKGVDWNLEDKSDEYSRILQDAQIYQQEAMRQSIKSQTETYIWNKARALSMTVELEIFLQEEYPYTPCQIRITGHASPYAKSQLSQFIQDEIGIPKEAQIWTAATS